MKLQRFIRGRRGRARNVGMGLIEIMIALTICAILLVACATAFTASANAINNNDAFMRCSQAGRVSLNQILAEIRNCDVLDMTTANTIKVIRPQPVAIGFTQEYVAAANEVSRSFVYDPTNKRITLQITYTTAGVTTFSPVYELTRNVSACSFGPVDMGMSYDQVHSMPVHIPITVTISTGKNSVTLCGSAVPRREAKY